MIVAVISLHLFTSYSTVSFQCLVLCDCCAIGQALSTSEVPNRCQSRMDATGGLKLEELCYGVPGPPRLAERPSRSG
ncbi:hypothetical protein B0J18DRAFT_143810 [Chaetomium sp. MPI-SDFR-AT-0129]|nr:hypothetical protein B0J18DRAFT_143810 [Chaetomium sp. MPI-SDFR-AT-0129]